jgi:hypothetical protein
MRLSPTRFQLRNAFLQFPGFVREPLLAALLAPQSQALALFLAGDYFRCYVAFPPADIR